MRMTNSMLMNNYLDNLYNNLGTVAKRQKQVATGKRITKLSDDPVGVISSMQCRVKLYKLDQYSENIDNAHTWLEQAETSVLEMNEIIQSAYETAVNMSSEYMTNEDKSAAAELIGQLRDHVVTIGNNVSGDKFIFGGNNVTNAPFTVNTSGQILYNGLDLTNDTNPALIAENLQVIEYEIGYDMKAQISISGSKLLGMGDDNIYTVMDGLYNALKGDGSPDQISTFIDKLQSCQSHVLAVDAELGGRINRLDLVANRYEEDFLNYSELKSNIEDVDQAEAIMNFKMAEAVYTAALQIGSNIIQPSLVDFLH